MQTFLRKQVCLEPIPTVFHSIAGIDVSYNIKQGTSHAVVVLMTLQDLQPYFSITTSMLVPFPYIPGLLSFREIPVILKALHALPEVPDLLMVDGHGIAHPRRLGIAAHLGVLVGIPSIGVAKSRLIGSYQEPGIMKGDQSLLLHRQERIGTVLRSKNHTKPLFISPGHLMDHSSSVALTLQCLTRYRLPEPTRIADKLSKTSLVKENASFEAVCF